MTEVGGSRSSDGASGRQAEAFLDQLRYFNEMLTEMQALLHLEEGELVPARKAESALGHLLEQRQRVARELATAEATVITARESLERLQGRTAQTVRDAEILIEALMGDLQQRPDVRAQYVTSLRQLHASLGEAAMPAPPQREPGSPPAPPEAAGAPLPPLNVRARAEEGSVVVLSWDWPSSGGTEALRFEIEAAAGTLGSHRGRSVPLESRHFVSVGATEENLFAHAVVDSASTPAPDGTPVVYRVRIRRGQAVSPWSETVSVACVRQAGVVAEPRRGGLRSLMAGVIGNIMTVEKIGETTRA